MKDHLIAALRAALPIRIATNAKCGHFRQKRGRDERALLINDNVIRVTAGGGWCCPFCKKALKHSGFTRIRERQGASGPYTIIDVIRSDNWADPPPTPRESGPAAENPHKQISADMASEDRAVILRFNADL